MNPIARAVSNAWSQRARAVAILVLTACGGTVSAASSGSSMNGTSGTGATSGAAPSSGSSGSAGEAGSDATAQGEPDGAAGPTGQILGCATSDAAIVTQCSSVFGVIDVDACTLPLGTLDTAACASLCHSDAALPCELYESNVNQVSVDCQMPCPMH